MRKPTKSTRLAVALAVGLGLAGSATAVYAAGADPDGLHLKTKWVNGGDGEIELEDRNEEPPSASSGTTRPPRTATASTAAS